MAQENPLMLVYNSEVDSVPMKLEAGSEEQKENKSNDSVRRAVDSAVEVFRDTGVTVVVFANTNGNRNR